MTDSTTETRKVNHATCHGRLDPELLKREVALGFGAHKAAKAWPTWRGTFHDLLVRLTGYQFGPKDAEAMLQGYLRDKATGRKAAEMAANDIMLLDYDTGAPIIEVVERVKSKGLLALIHSTHSHLTTESDYALEAVSRFMVANDRGTAAPTLADAIAFMRDEKRIRPEILEGATLTTGAESTRIYIKHNPLPKARVLLLLDKPYVFTDEASRQRWKDLYGGVARELGFAYDPSCADPSRLMYLPRMQNAADLPSHEMHVLPGKALDLTTITVETPADRIKRTAEGTAKAEADANKDKPKDKAKAKAKEEWKPANFARFLKIGGASFRASDWLRDLEPKEVRNVYEGQGKSDHRCPREECHTEVDESDRAFCVWNAVDGKGFSMSCRHAGCIAFATRPDGKEDRAAFLALLCKLHDIKDASDLIEWCSDEAKDKWHARPLLFVPDHMATAREFLARCHTVDGRATIVRHRGQWHTWNGRQYVTQSTEAMQGVVARFLDGCDRLDEERNRRPVNPNANHVSNVLMMLAAQPGVCLDNDVDAPAWLGGQGDMPRAADMLACANGLLHIPTRKLYPHTPAFYSPTALPYPYNPAAPKPTTFLAFLDQIFGGEQAQIVTLQKWFALLLSGDRRYQKILYLEGPTRSGRGTLLSVIEAMLGEANVVGAQLGNLVKDNGLAALIGKRAAVFGDVHLEDIKSTSHLVELLLSLSAGDKVTVRRKYLDDWTGTLPALLTMASNAPLRLKNASGALPGRFIALQTRRSFLGQEDLDLKAKLLAELPGILLWGLDGRLELAWGGFKQPEEFASVIEAMRDGAMPLHKYVRERLDVGPGLTADRDEVFADYTQWTARNGGFPSGKAEFGIELHAAVRAIAKLITPVSPLIGRKLLL